MDDPEGNLVIVERVGHESQRHFPYWEHSWAGTAHRSASTQYDTPRTTALWSNTSHNHIVIIERVAHENQRGRTVGTVLPTCWQAPDTAGQITHGILNFSKQMPFSPYDDRL